MSVIVKLLAFLVSVLVFLNSSKIAPEKSAPLIRMVSALIAVISAVAAFFDFVPIAVISAGSVGVVESFGQVSDRVLLPGIHVTRPFSEVVEYSTRLTDIKETIESTSEEGLNLVLDVSLQYRLEPQNAAQVYTNIGTDEKEIVISRFRSIVREITAQYPARDIYSNKRQEIAQQIRTRLTQEIEPLGFVVEQALLREVVLPETVQAAIQQKLAAEQESERMAFILEKERQEAERKRVEAQGISDFQKEVSQGLTSQYLQWKGIQATEQLAESQNAKIVIIGSGEGGLPVILQPDTAVGN
jgi:regulator of protease activity HflC (stomatin/prohibitin superfamily)